MIVEGRYDKEKLGRVIDAQIITTDGFSIFNSGEKRQMITRLAEKNGVIVLTDSDGAGTVIRNYFRSVLPPDKLINLYIPQIKGKEKRKSAPSKAGYLGVEGMDERLLEELFAPFASDDPGVRRGGLTKTDMYFLGLSGRGNSREKRDITAKAAGLPAGMSAGALLEALNLLYPKEKAVELINASADSGENES